MNLESSLGESGCLGGDVRMGGGMDERAAGE